MPQVSQLAKDMLDLGDRTSSLPVATMINETNL